MAARGREAYAQQAAAANANKGGGYAYILILGDGEQVQGRFRGLLVPPNYTYSAEQLMSMSEAQADHVAASLGMYNVYDSQKDFCDKVLERYEQIEPFNYFQHFISGNKGPDAYLTCGQAYGEEVVIWDPPVECVPCHLKDNGDKRISRRAQVAFSFVPKRKTHRLKASVVGRKDTYEVCTEDTGYCVHCERNNEARWDGMRYVSLSQTHAGGLFACADRVSKRCAECGITVLRSQGWCCAHPDCGEPVANPHWATLNQALSQGQKIAVTCQECGHKGPPNEILHCSRGCENPRRCQLHDVDVLIQRIGGDKKTTYQFTEQLPAEPLEEKLLSFRLPRYEQKLKPSTTDRQSRLCGLHANPFTKAAIGGDPQATESYDETEEPIEGNVEPFDQ